MLKLNIFLYRLMKNFYKNDVIGTAAQTAFYLTLSIPPLLALTISISSNLSVSGAIFPLLEFVFPASISDILSVFLVALPKSKSVTVISAVGVIFAASGSAWALMRGIHKAYNRRNLRYTVKNRLVATLFTAVLIISIIISLGSVLVGSVLSALFDTLSKKGILYELSKRMFAILGVYIFVHFLYKYTPDVKLKGAQLFWGSLFSACGWVLVSMLFGIYVRYFTRYTTVYGGIGAFFILILWLFVICAIILTGAQINGTLNEIQKKLT